MYYEKYTLFSKEIDGTYALDNGNIKLTISGQDVHRSDIGPVKNAWFCGHTILLPQGRRRKRAPTALIKLPDGDVLELSTAGYQKRWKKGEPHDSQVISFFVIHDLKFPIFFKAEWYLPTREQNHYDENIWCIC